MKMTMPFGRSLITAGIDLRKWIEMAKDRHMTKDRHILHRVATFTDRQRRRFEKYGFELRATPEMELNCTMPSTSYILPERDPLRKNSEAFLPIHQTADPHVLSSW